MNTRVLMGASAVLVAILGFVATFLPQETVAYLGSQADGSVLLVVQIAGALYWGFAIVNWMSRANAIGGIYSRPLALGNFLHLFMVALTIWRLVAAGQNTILIVSAAVISAAFAVSFGWVLFTQPRTQAQRK